MSDAPLSNIPGGNAGASRTKLPWLIIAVAIAIIAAAAIWVSGRGDSAKTSDTLVVATEGTYAPFTYQADGKLTGYDIDVIKAVAKEAGLKLTFKQTQWDSIFAGVDSGRFDLIANEVTVNPERAAKYLLSEPYSISTGVLVVRKDNTTVKSFDDVEGKTAAQSLTSNWADEAEKLGAKIQAVAEWDLAASNIVSGRVDLAINDKLAVLDYLKKNPTAPLKIVATSPNVQTQAFVLSKSPAHRADLRKINAALTAMKADGRLAAIGKKYFGEDISK
jgi:cystine transport system substrate-binding protein